MPRNTNKGLTPVVEAISKLDITGNVVPREWLIRLKMPNGMPDPIGALVLAEIIFWYRWTVIRDEATQHAVRYERRFRADKLQKSYQQLSNALGFSRQQVRSAIDRLEGGGYITKEIRSFPSKEGVMLFNVMFLEPIPDAIERLTFAPVQSAESNDDATNLSDDDYALIDATLEGDVSGRSVMGNTPHVMHNTPYVTGNIPSPSA